MEKYIFLAAVLFVLALIRRNHQHTVRLKYRYKFYELRDKLRQEAINGCIKKSNWEFAYLDSSLSRTVNRLVHINLMSMFIYSFLYRNDNRKEGFHRHLKIAIDKNIKVGEIYNEYGELLISYMRENHIVIVGCILYAIRSIRFARIILNTVDNSIRDLRETPETSTAYKFLGSNRHLEVA